MKPLQNLTDKQKKVRRSICYDIRLFRSNTPITLSSLISVSTTDFTMEFSGCTFTGSEIYSECKTVLDLITLVESKHPLFK